MKFFILINVLGAVLVTNALPPQRIVGGENAKDGEFPYQASLRYPRPDTHHCGGSIITNRYILTAAHCIRRVYQTQITVVVGTNSVKEGGDRYGVEQIISHHFDPDLAVRDIAMLRTDTDILFTEKIQPIKLPDRDISEHGHPVVATGWGALNIGGEFPTLLQKVTLRIYDQAKCRSAFSVGDGEICALTKAGEGVCSGDSGGPLVTEGVQVGIVSYGRPCARGTPDVFTRVYHYVDWIREHMQE